MKKGFTLAEVLITLGIIGVVAALTAPALIQNTGTAKVGPTLAKAVTTLELANQNMLTETESSTIKAALSDAENNPVALTKTYIETLSNYMHITPYDANSGTPYSKLIKNYNGEHIAIGAPGTLPKIIGIVLRDNTFYATNKDGLLYVIVIGLDNKEDVNLPKHQRVLGCVFIDINGKSKPNRVGKDVFAFIMLQNGTMVPFGSSSDSASRNWQNGTTDKCNADEVTTGWSCAGSIFENGLKVIYQ